LGRTLAALASAVALTAGCSDDGAGGGEPAEATAPDLPSSVDTVGPITEPLMQPIWLVRSTGTAEAGDYDLRGQGLFVDGDIAVYYALDTILGVSMEDGSELWRSPVDMGGEIVEHAGTAPHGDHLWSFVYPETKAVDYDESGDHLVTVDITTGKVVNDLTVGTFGAVDAMASAGGDDYVATEKGLMRVTDEGELEQVASLRDLGGGRNIYSLTPVHGTDVLTVVTTDNLTEPAHITGVDVADGKVLWTHPGTDFADTARELGYVSVSPGDGRYVTRRDWEENASTGGDAYIALWVLDPETGEIEHESRTLQSNYTADDHLMMITSEDLNSGNPYGMFPVGDDIVFEDYHGVSRYDPVAEKYVWSTRVGVMGLRNADSGVATFGLGPTSPDGKLVYAVLSAGASGDLVAIDLETGKIKGRWAFDDEMDAGLVGRPLMVMDGDKVLLARNRTVEGDPTLMDEKAKPLGELNDLGLMQFPEVD
jgi:hypothetical protein